MAMLDFILGAVLPSFLQNEGRQRQQLASPTLAQAQPQEQQPPQQQTQFAPYPTFDQGQAYNPDQLKHLRGNQMLTQSAGGQSELPTEPAAAMDQQPKNMMTAPRGEINQEPQAASAPPTQPPPQAQSVAQPQPASGGNLVDQITRLATSPLGLGGMGAAAGILGAPKSYGFGGAAAQGLMGSMYGLQAGSQLQNQREQTQSAAQYHQQQAEAQRQHMLLEQQKLQQKQLEDQRTNTVWGTLTDEEKKRVVTGQKSNPNEWSVLEQAFPGDYKRQLDEFAKIKKTEHAGSSFGSFQGEMEGKKIPYGSEEFNKEWIKRQAEIQGSKPADKRAEAEVPKKDKQREIENRNKFLSHLESYKKSAEYVIADDADKPVLLEKKKKELWSDLGLPGSPPAEKKTSERLPSQAGKVTEKSVADKFGL